ncbi:MAG: type I 3-dehydroquinate dehydratase [Promethearchaeia archaeon]
MSFSSEKICIAIPLFTSNREQIAPLIEEACNKEPDFLEIRFDYMDDISEISENFLQFLMSENQDIPYIFTFRHPSEGGQSEVSTKKQVEIVHTLINSKPQFIDIELNKEYKYLSELIAPAIDLGVNLIFSYHNFHKTPNLDELEKLIKQFEKKLITEIEQDYGNWKHIYKVIPTAQRFTDNLISLELCKSLSQHGMMVVSFCMGEKGIFSRVLSLKAGSFFTYASSGEKTAPGQVNIDVVRKILSLIE